MIEIVDESVRFDKWGKVWYALHMGKGNKLKGKLSQREMLLATYMAEGIEKTSALRLAGYNEGSYHVANKPRVQDEVRSQILKRIPSSLLANTLEEGLQATKFLQVGKEVMEVPDWIARHKYLETALRLANAYPAEKHEVEVDTVEARLRRAWGGS